VVRVIRYQQPTEDGRRLGTVEDEHGNLRDLGAGDTPGRRHRRCHGQQG
jgi:hypothetical protein